RQVAARGVRLRAELLLGKAGPIDPERRISERLRPCGIPSRMGYEQDLLAPEAEGFGRQLVRARVRLVAAHLVRAQDLLEEGGQARRLEVRTEHPLREVGEEPESQARPLEGREGGTDVGPWIEREERVHQGVTLLAVEVQAQFPARVIQGVPGHLPEVDVLAGEDSQPRVLELAEAPFIAEGGA